MCSTYETDTLLSYSFQIILLALADNSHQFMLLTHMPHMKIICIPFIIIMQGCFSFIGKFVFLHFNTTYNSGLEALLDSFLNCCVC